MRSEKHQAFVAAMVGGLVSLAIGTPAVAAGAPATERAARSHPTSAASTPATAAIPAAGSTDAARRCTLVGFEEATVLPGEDGRSWTLIVSGVKPATNISVELRPVTYIRQPEYWLIEVVGCSFGIGLPVLTPYATKLDVTGTLGTLGIEVQGSNGSQVIPVSRPIDG